MRAILSTSAASDRAAPLAEQTPSVEQLCEEWGKTEATVQQTIEAMNTMLNTHPEGLANLSGTVAMLALHVEKLDTIFNQATEKLAERATTPPHCCNKERVQLFVLNIAEWGSWLTALTSLAINNLSEQDRNHPALKWVAFATFISGTGLGQLKVRLQANMTQAHWKQSIADKEKLGGLISQSHVIANAKGILKVYETCQTSTPPTSSLISHPTSSPMTLPPFLRHRVDSRDLLVFFTHQVRKNNGNGTPPKDPSPASSSEGMQSLPSPIYRFPDPRDMLIPSPADFSTGPYAPLPTPVPSEYELVRV